MDGKGIDRLVLVLDIDDTNKAATVCLVSNEIEFAGAADLILKPAETGLPYDAIAETDMAGPMWTFQLRDPVGSVDIAT